MVKSLTKFLTKKQEEATTSPSVEAVLNNTFNAVDQSASPFGSLVFSPSKPSSKGVNQSFDQSFKQSRFYIESELIDTPQTAVQLKSPDECNQLLETLLNGNWCVLKADDSDPLDILFSRSLTQWQVLANPDAAQNTVYLLWKEQVNMLEDAQWSLYENGNLIYTGKHLAQFDELMDADALDTMAIGQYLEKGNTNALINTLAVRPAVFSTLKKPLFDKLEQFYESTNIPVLNFEISVMLAEKTRVVGLFKQLAQAGILDRAIDCIRLDAGLKRLTSEFSYFNQQQQNGLDRSLFLQAQSQYRQYLTDGLWRVRLTQAA